MSSMIIDLCESDTDADGGDHVLMPPDGFRGHEAGRSARKRDSQVQAEVYDVAISGIDDEQHDNMSANDAENTSNQVEVSSNEDSTTSHCAFSTEGRTTHSNHGTTGKRREYNRVYDAQDEHVTSSSDDEPIRRRYPRLPLARNITSSGRAQFTQNLQRLEARKDIHQLYPRSLCPDWNSQAYVCEERQVLQKFVESESKNNGSCPEEDEDGFEELEIYDFSIYRSVNASKNFKGRLESLHVVASEQRSGAFVFDGTVKQDGHCMRMIGVTIVAVNIGGLEDNGVHTTKDKIWIQSTRGQQNQDTWYRLCIPAPEYERFWLDFLWLADFNKHFLDYLFDASKHNVNIRLKNFASDFWSTISEWHKNDEVDFPSWHKRSQLQTDYRQHLTWHASFLRDQAHTVGQLAGCKSVMDHDVWEEVGTGKVSLDRTNEASIERTVMTSNVASGFSITFPEWKEDRYDLIDIVEFAPEVLLWREQQRSRLHFPDKFRVSQAKNFSKLSERQLLPKAALLLEEAGAANVSTNLSPSQLLGHVVVVRYEPPTSRRSLSGPSGNYAFQFAWVKELTSSGKSLRVVWLALPSDTICGSEFDGTHYPIGNELFFVDKCNCEPILVSNVVGAYKVTVFSDCANVGAELFVHSLYSDVDETFTTVTESNLLCTCHKSWRTKEWRRQDPRVDRTQGSNPSLSKLRNLSLFAGAGLLDHGLESSGFFETVFAIDQNELAICSNAANTTSNSCRHVVGSVNEWLKRFMTGKMAIPRFDCVSAGCPCQGFSLINNHKNGKKSQRNCSLLAGTLSWVELLLPPYCLIENVPTMDHANPKKGVKNACAQAICHLVALGYQVRKLVCNASTLGDATGRERLFLFAAAPGLVLPSTPEHTHGKRSGLEDIATVRTTIGDLDSISDEYLINVLRPDHVPLMRLDVHPSGAPLVSLRNVVQRIPKDPSGMGLVETYDRGLLSKSQRAWFTGTLSAEKQAKTSKTLRRIDPDKPFRTITATFSPLDSRHSGQILHPFQDRTLSIQEFRRAQSLPDSFLLVGKPLDQMEQIGNGVPWNLAAAIGTGFGIAWQISNDVAPIDAKHGKDRATIVDTREEPIVHTQSPSREASTSPLPVHQPSSSFQSKAATFTNTNEQRMESEDSSYHEHLCVEPNGTIDYQRYQRQKTSRSIVQLAPIAGEVPLMKRAALTASIGEGDGSDSDSDVVYLRTEEVAKRSRFA